MDLFLAHTLALLWLSLAAVRRLAASPHDRLLAAALLAWGNLTLTHRLLAPRGHLADPAWLLGVSVGLALLVGWGLTRVPEEPAGDRPAAARPVSILLFALTLVPLAVRRFQPGFLDQPGDPEILNVAAWLVGGLALHRLGRLAAVPPDAALLACWLALAATLAVGPGLFAGPALPLAAGGLTLAVFALQWRLTRRRRYAALALLAGLFLLGGASRRLQPDLEWSGPVPPAVELPPVTPGETRVFAADLVLGRDSGLVTCAGLRPPEGPFPSRQLPRFRSVRQPAIRLTLPADARLARLRVRFSLGLLQRDKTEIAVRLNGREVRTLRLTRRSGWLDDTLLLDAAPGVNVLEFADVPHQRELDWRGYLERYPDVMRHLVTHNVPLEEGALEHYAVSGKPEGRLMTERAVPPPAPGAYYFVFRELYLEGLAQP